MSDPDDDTHFFAAKFRHESQDLGVAGWLDETSGPSRLAKPTRRDMRNYGSTLVATSASRRQDLSLQYSWESANHRPWSWFPPTFFKVIVVVKNDKISNFACFVVPNDESANDKLVQDYIVSWTDLETVTGLSFYPCLADNVFKARADLLTQQVSPGSDSGKLLLLTDGRPNNNKSIARKTLEEMRHLCDDQSYVPRKQRQ